MQTKLKRSAPYHWQTRLFDLLRLSSRFEVKVNLNAVECAAYLAKVLPYSDKQIEYVFKMDKDSSLKSFQMTRLDVTLKRNPEGYLVGYLIEEPNLEITTIFGKVYPEFFPIFGPLIFIVFTFPLVQAAISGEMDKIQQNMRCFLPITVFMILGLIISLVWAFQGKRQLKNYFLSRLKAVSSVEHIDDTSTNTSLN